MINKLKQHGVKHLWHFTDKSNLELIEENDGLLSLRKITKDNISIPVFGGNQWSHDADRRKKLDKFVHLAFLDDHPMFYKAKQEERIKEPVWLSIDLSVLQVDNVKFSSDVSNKSGVLILDNDQATEEIDFEVLFTRTDWRNPEIQERRQTAIKSEILIPNIVPLEKIIGWKNG